MEKDNKGYDRFVLCDPYAIVTMKKDLTIKDSYHNKTYNLLKDDILVYVSGERSAQRTPYDLAYDFHFSINDYPDIDIIFVELFGSYEDDFFDEIIYEKGSYETDLIKMITIDKYIKEHYNVDKADLKEKSVENKKRNSSSYQCLSDGSVMISNHKKKGTIMDYYFKKQDIINNEIIDENKIEETKKVNI